MYTSDNPKFKKCACGLEVSLADVWLRIVLSSQKPWKTLLPQDLWFHWENPGRSKELSALWLGSFKHPRSQTHKISVPGLWLRAGLCTWPAALSSPHLGNESSGRSSPGPPAAGQWRPCDSAFVCGAGIHNVPPKWCLEMYSRWKTREVANLIIGICALTVE